MLSRTAKTKNNANVRTRAAIEPLEDRRMMTVNAWKGAVTGDWNDATKWSLGHVPTSAEDVTITLAGSYTVKHATSTANSVKSLTINAAVELDSGSITVSGATTVTGGKLTFAGGTLIKGTLATSGSGAIVTTASGGAIDGVTLDSSVSMAAGSVLGLRDTITFANSAKFSVGTAHAYLQDSTTGPIALAGTGTLNIAGGQASADKNHGHLPTIGSGILIDGSGVVNFQAGTNSGTVAADVSGKILTVSGTLTNSGVSKAINGATLELNNPSTFTNQGTISAAAGTVMMAGAFKAGSGTLAVGIGGTGQGSSYGLIKVVGALTLGGTLSVSTINNFKPAASASFTPVTYTSESGAFSGESLTTNGITFTPTISTTALTIKAPAASTAGVVLTLTYTQLQIATNSAFTTGLQKITLSSTGTNNITLKPGEYFRFGMNAVVTGNPNPISGDAWDKAEQKAGKTAQPAQLGISVFGTTIATTGDQSNIVAPVNSGGLSTADVEPSNAPAWSIESSGSVSGGTVGVPNPLGAGYITPSATAASSAAELAAFAHANTLFSNLVFSAGGAGTTTLTPLIDTAALSFFTAINLGTVSGSGSPATSATYRSTLYAATDKIVNAAPIHITVT